MLVQHLSPDHKSSLVGLVKHYTKMQVSEVADGVEVQPNCAYIIRAEALAFVKQLAAGQTIESFHTQRICKDGLVLDVWLTASLLVDESGRAYAIATTERNVAEE